jgi:pimeloyl-ACP methyl ester carboxylesterase
MGRARPALSAALVVAGLLASCMPPSWGAGALLHPQRRRVEMVPALPHLDASFQGDGIELKGWRFPARAPARGVTVVYLHGVADNRASGVWIAERLVGSGYDVVAYDGRAHGDSGGDACTYGYHEKRDLSRVLDQLGATRVVLVGASLGAAVALQAAAEDGRVIGVAAAAVFADLASIAHDRAWFASEGQIARALALAAREGNFEVGEVSPARAAARVRVPVLLVHGENDAQTRPEHSRRVLAALAGPKRLVLVPGAGHDDALGKAWGEVERLIDEVAAAAPLPAAAEQSERR